MGGGFCGILNSVVLLAIREVLYESGAHTPGILILDSALTQLSETQMSSVILSSSTCSTIRRADKLFSLTKKKKCPHGSVRSRNASITNSPRHVGKDVMVFFMMFMMRNKLPEGTIENQL